MYVSPTNDAAMEGWVVVVSNIHEEALEDDVLDVFSEYGKVRDLHLNLDRRTGYVKVRSRRMLMHSRDMHFFSTRPKLRHSEPLMLVNRG